MRKFFIPVLFCAVLVVFAGCSATLPAEDTFLLSIDEVDTSFSVGETTTFTARLVNTSDQAYIADHGFNLINLYVYHKGEEPPYIEPSLLVTSTIEAHADIEKTLRTEWQEAGEYILRAECVFSIDGQEYRLTCEEIPLTIEP